MIRCPFRILVDNREKIPFSFADMEMPIRGKVQPVAVETVEACLGNNNGDYGAEGVEDVRIERKSLEDLYGTLADRDAFREQVSHMNFCLKASFIVIEASWPEVRDPSKFATPLKWDSPEASTFCVFNGSQLVYRIQNELGTWKAFDAISREFIHAGHLTTCMNACERRCTETAWRSELHPNSVVNTIASWRIQFPRVHWLAPGGRRLAEITTFELLRHAWRYREKAK